MVKSGAAEVAGVRVGSIVLEVCGESLRGRGVAAVGTVVQRALGKVSTAAHQGKAGLSCSKTVPFFSKTRNGALGKENQPEQQQSRSAVEFFM